MTVPDWVVDRAVLAETALGYGRSREEIGADLNILLQHAWSSPSRAASSIFGAVIIGPYDEPEYFVSLMWEG